MHLLRIGYFLLALFFLFRFEGAVEHFDFSCERFVEDLLGWRVFCAKNGLPFEWTSWLSAYPSFWVIVNLFFESLAVLLFFRENLRRFAVVLLLLAFLPSTLLHGHYLEIFSPEKAGEAMLSMANLGLIGALFVTLEREKPIEEDQELFEEITFEKPPSKTLTMATGMKIEGTPLVSK